ncbi:unannotated protein [freshwater metagenome]|uniref:Unannotated protein n=1 Tax=freshwater metagenome TaxID=449393 RepID=A0A6J6CB60_9ZZZZ
MLIGNLHALLTDKGPGAGKHFIEHDSAGVDIGSLGGRTSGYQLGRHVADCPQQFAGFGSGIHVSCQTKVT